MFPGLFTIALSSVSPASCVDLNGLLRVAFVVWGEELTYGPTRTRRRTRRRRMGGGLEESNES